MNQENLHEWISRYTDGELNEVELKQFLAILASDPEVRSEAVLDRELTDFLRDRDLLSFLEVIDQARYRKRFGFGLNCLLLAAVMTILVALSGVWIYIHPVWKSRLFSPEREVVSTGIHRRGSSANELPFVRRSPGFFPIGISGGEQDQGLLAANFQPLTYLEGWVGVVTRSGRFSLLSPQSNLAIHPGDTVKFSWRNQGITSVTFYVINNRGELVVSREGIRGISLTLLTTSWEEGLYYWKFLDQDNLLHVGKIFIRK